MFNIKTIIDNNMAIEYHEKILNNSLGLYLNIIPIEDEFNYVMAKITNNNYNKNDIAIDFRNILTKQNKLSLIDGLANLEEIAVLTLKILYTKNKIRSLNLDSFEDIITFLKELYEKQIWQIEIISKVSEKFELLKEKCSLIYKKYCEENKLSQPFTGLQEEQERWFNNTKRKYAEGSIENIFESIDIVERNPVPYKELVEFNLIFGIVNYKENDETVIERLSLVNDPYVLMDCLTNYVKNIDFTSKLIKSEYSKLICFGLCKLYDTFKIKEANYLKYIRDNIILNIQNKQYAEIFELLQEKKVLQNEIETLLKETLGNLFADIKNKSEHFTILIVFLKKYFILSKSNYAGQKYLLNSFDIYYNITTEIIFAQLSKHSSYYDELKRLYQPNEHNIYFYGSLLWRLSIKKTKHHIVKEISNIYFNDFVKRINSEEHTPYFGFDYEYQINYINGILSVVLAGSKINPDKIFYLKKIINEIQKMVEKYEDPITKEQVLSHNRFNNMTYLFMVAFEVWRNLNKFKIKIDKGIIVIILQLLDKILGDWKYSTYSSFNVKHLWVIFAGLSKKNRIIRNYYYKNISDLDAFVQLCETSVKIPNYLIKKIEKDLVFDLSSTDTQDLIKYYWLIYLKFGLEDLLDLIYKKLPKEMQDELKECHILRFDSDINIEKLLSLFEKQLQHKLDYNYSILKFGRYFYLDKREPDNEKIINNIIELLS